MAVLPPPDPSIWCDFNKVANYIDTIFIYFKSSHFNLNIRISDLALEESTVKPKSEKDKKSKDKVITETKTLIWPVKPLEYRNEPLYIFMDTVDTKFLVLSMSQPGCAEVLAKPPKKKFATVPDRLTGRRSTDAGSKRFSSVMDIIRRLSRQSSLNISAFEDEDIEEEEEKVYEYHRPFAYFAVERFVWQNNTNEFPLVFLNTYGSQATLVHFRKGRAVLKMWIRSDTSYILNILCDSPVEIGNMEIVSEAMSKESECFTEMCFHVATSFGKLVQKFGTSEYSQALKEFYACYKPDCKLSKFQTMAVHRTFMKLLVSLLAENFETKEFEDCIFALRVLFLDPQIKSENEAHYVHLCASPSIENHSLTSEDVLILKYIERSAVLVQAFFRRVYVRQLMRLHKDDNKKFATVFATLKNIYTALFSVQKRLQTCPTLLRAILESLNLETSKCPLQEDLQSVVHLQTFRGFVVTAANAWIPVCRYMFHVNSYEPVAVRIHLFCEMRNHFVRVFNNDSGKEIPR